MAWRRPALGGLGVMPRMAAALALAAASTIAPARSGAEISVARAGAQEPRCVVLDEPTASLDFGNQGQVLREIRRLAASGLAVMFTTHDPNHALRFADQVLLIRDGGTMAQGPVRDLIDGAHLRRLYGAEIEELEDGGNSGRRAYLPG